MRNNTDVREGERERENRRFPSRENRVVAATNRKFRRVCPLRFGKRRLYDTIAGVGG